MYLFLFFPELVEIEPVFKFTKCELSKNPLSMYSIFI